MAIEIETLIKIILGAIVIVTISLGLYFFFKDSVIDFFKNLGPDKVNQPVKAILGLI